MEKRFLKYIDDHDLCKSSDRILLGLSGGIDSVCMFHLFRQLNYPIAIAHCNFQLREEESDEDEFFTQELAHKFDIPFFSTRFNTKEIAEQEGISIQMAARDLRYDWFDEIVEKYDYNYIAIAHNRDDVVETLLINLTRGTGIEGLTGIKPKNNRIIRPLLFASRKEILEYLTKNNFAFREDSSNESTKYSRNLIRHEIIPLFEQINPKFRETIIENSQKLNETKLIYKEAIKHAKDIVLSENQGKVFLNIAKLKSLNPIFTYLFEILNPYGFTNSQIQDIIHSMDSISGKRFYSPTHKLIKDRSNFIVEELSVIKKSTYFIEPQQISIEKPINLNFELTELTNNFKIIKEKNIAQLDFEKLDFPLVMRKWEKGDYFMPLGMNNLKKLSDFFIDQKFSILDKENTWLLESNNKIVWIIGHRIDQRFKITDQTTKIYSINYNESIAKD